MGCQVHIKIKDEFVESISTQIEKVSEYVDMARWTHFHNWANDINTNPESPQAHLKPTTAEDLQSMFCALMPLNTVAFDVYFGRTPQEELDKIFEFFIENKESIESIKNGRDWFERSSQKEEFFELEDLNDESFTKRENVNRREVPAGGIATTPCGFHLLYGNVKSPTVMKDDEFLSERDNKDLVVDGNRFLLMPLLDLGEKNQLNRLLCQFPNAIKTNKFAILVAMYTSSIVADAYKDFLDEMTEADIRFLVETGKAKLSDVEYATREDSGGWIVVRGKKRKLTDCETRCLEIGLNAYKDKFGTFSA